MQQLGFDFDSIPALQAKAPEPDYLILEMSKGWILGAFLKEFVDKGDKTITLSEQTEYPKGVSVKGKGQATFNPEVLMRVLTKGKLPSTFKTFSIRRGRYENNAPRFKGFKGFGNEYVEIRINGSLEIRKGNFKATIPTK